jgi:hypothetical protein
MSMALHEQQPPSTNNEVDSQRQRKEAFDLRILLLLAALSPSNANECLSQLRSHNEDVVHSLCQTNYWSAYIKSNRFWLSFRLFQKEELIQTKR